MNSKTACRGVRVSGGDLCEAEAPTEPAGETKSFCPCHEQVLKPLIYKGFRTFLLFATKQKLTLHFQSQFFDKIIFPGQCSFWI